MAARTLFFGFTVTAAGAVSSQSNPTGVYQTVTGERLAPLDVFRECDVCPEMIVMPSGAFLMGATQDGSRNPFDIYGAAASGEVRSPEADHKIPNEHPQHKVVMDIPFAIGRNEITHGEWMACVDAGGCTHRPDHRTVSARGEVVLGPEHPVINVSYLDATEYAQWLNAHIGAPVYRLPTEAEWEYAARAGTTTRFAQGDDLTSAQANFLGRVTEQSRGLRFPELLNRDTAVPVTALDAANAWGVRHMSGNVWELTLSCWTDQHLGLGTDRAYLAHATAQDTCRRVAKGGGFQSGMDNLRPARRTRPSETRRRDIRGFRLIREF